ncbi:hypothetical protein Tco_0915369 [Tanacetum coccineum]
MSKQSREVQDHDMTVNMEARNPSETKLWGRLLASKYRVKQGSSFQGPSLYTTIPPPKMVDKEKGIVQSTDDGALKKIMPYIEEWGSVPNLSKNKRLADLKAAKDKSEKKLKRLTPAQLKAQAQELIKSNMANT